MKALGRLFFVLLLLGNLTYMMALSVHVVQAPGKIRLVPKGQTSLLDTIVDTRDWTSSDLREHAAVVTDINRAGRGELIAHVNTASVAAPRDTTATPSSPKPVDASSSDSTSKNVFDFSK